MFSAPALYILLMQVAVPRMCSFAIDCCRWYPAFVEEKHDTSVSGPNQVTLWYPMDDTREECVDFEVELLYQVHAATEARPTLHAVTLLFLVDLL